ncbi:hypothetical protein EDC04DRAFT_2610808 [Pisolithus marmoratus]|nr:hypothetical protein EDC04DRAFT_2610808 [Pisolithus marmoratus]
MDFGSDILTCNNEEVSEDTLQCQKQTEAGQSANQVKGHAWQSIDIQDPNGSAEEQLQEGFINKVLIPPPPKSMLFKTMVDHRWQSANPEIVLLDGVQWLNGFYSQMNEGDIFEVDANYLKELDQWLKSSDAAPESSGEEDDINSKTFCYCINENDPNLPLIPLI